MASRSFNSAPPAEDLKLWTEYQIGWEHTLVGEGSEQRLVLTHDEAGQPVPRSYIVPLVVSGEQALRCAQLLHDADAKSDVEKTILAVGSLLGDDTITTIAADPSVPSDKFLEFLEALVEDLDLENLFGSSGNVEAAPSA